MNMEEAVCAQHRTSESLTQDSCPLLCLLYRKTRKYSNTDSVQEMKIWKNHYNLHE